MKINAVWSIYFSATGTTKKVACRVARIAAEVLAAEYKSFSFSLPEARRQTLTFSSTDLVVLATPVYAGRTPNLFLPYLQNNIIGNGALATPLSLYGNRNYDDALIELRDILQNNGFHTVSAGAFVGEHSFSNVLGAGRPDKEDMEQAEILGRETAQKILKSPAPPQEAIAVTGCQPLRPYYTPRDRIGNPINILKVKPKTDMSICTDCGLCASICTMGSINPENVQEIPGVCTKCCACVKSCPAGAKYFDDEGYLYHLRELEDMYTSRAPVDLFY